MGRTHRQQYQLSERKLNNFRKCYPEIDVVIMEECRYKELRKTQDDLKYFLNNVYRPLPKKRFSLQSASIPGRTEIFRLYWNSEDYPNEKFMSLDYR